MKEGYVLKNYDSGRPRNGEIDLINKYTRRKLNEDEVYVFTVVLCDNDIDREYEMFTDSALEELAKMFVGKTGIIDHEASSENQTARIFFCRVERVEGKTNQVDKEYKRLIARAYMPRSKKNEDLILEIDSGIKKEVSIGCAVDSITCSICGEDVKSGLCEHVKGRKYKLNTGLRTCYLILDNPKDAYEWSFVAVPAQKEAGVIKSFKGHMEGGETKMQDIIKKMSLGETISLSKEQSLKLYDYVSSLQKKADVGQVYFNELKSEVIKLSAIVQPDIDLSVMKSVIDKMSVLELKSFKECYKARMSEVVPVRPQLVSEECDNKENRNTQFKI